MGSETKTKRPKWPVGAPPKLNEQLIKTICDAIKMGAYIETAAQYAGVPKKTFHDWLKRGSARKNNIYGQLSHSIEQAWAEAELRDVLALERAAKGELEPKDLNNPNKVPDYILKPDWRAAAWRLERKFARRWGQKSTLKIEDDETPESKSGLTDQDLHKVLFDIINEDE